MNHTNRTHKWTDEDTKSYWEEVEMEDRSDRGRSRWSVDPLSWRLSTITCSPWDEDGPWASPNRINSMVNKDTYHRAVSMLPDIDRKVLAEAMKRRGGRSGDGITCAKAMGIPQYRWVTYLDRAEAHLAVVAPWATTTKGAWDANKMVRKAKHPDAVRAYLSCWKTSVAARMIGRRQSTVWDWLQDSGPIILDIVRRPKRHSRVRG